MNPQTEKNLNEHRLQKLVNEIDSDSVEVTPVSISSTSNLVFTGVTLYVKTIVNWFWYLSSSAKLVVIVVGFLIGCAILQAALKLIASVISMALIAVLLYLGYKFFVAGNSSQIEE